MYAMCILLRNNSFDHEIARASYLTRNIWKAFIYIYIYSKYIYIYFLLTLFFSSLTCGIHVIIDNNCTIENINILIMQSIVIG